MLFNEATLRWQSCVDVGTRAACSITLVDVGLLLVLALGIFLVFRMTRRFIRNLLTLPALAWMPIVSRRLSYWVKSLDYTEEEFLRADGAGEIWANRRK